MPPRNKPYNNKLNSDKKLPPKGGASGAAKLQHPTTTHTAAADAPQSDSYFPNLDNHNLIFSYNVLSTNLRASAISLYKLTTDIFTTLKTYASHARVFLQLKFKQAYPVLLRWFLYFANVILLLSMVWLDCALRGIDSFLRMGTTSFFSIIWFSLLSLLAMIGIFKFLLLLVIPSLLGIFVGFTFSLMAVAILGVLLLGLYGSFWTTMSAIFIGGVAFAFSHERLALFITTLYSVYCAWTYVGWLGLLLGLNLSFISSDALIYFLKNNVNEPTRPTSSSERTDGMRGRQGFFPGEYVHVPSSEADTAADRSPGAPSTSGFDSDITSEDEVVRLLNCTDHYSALGLSRFENIDVSLLKREYRKKAMLVHPDKNMGNEKAAEAFKKLQNAYEILLDSLKRRSYDDELKREELLNYFRRFQGASQKNGQHAFYPSGFTRPDNEDPFGESKRIVCKKCGNSHLWVYTKKAKARARWCQDCKNFHPAKDGDGWVEQSVQPFLFGMMQKVEAPTAYICAESKIYDATEWYICRGMRCPANSHKPSFHVNTNVTTSKHNSGGKGSSSGHKNGEMEDGMTEEEFFEWLQNAMQTGTIPPFSASTDNASAPPGNNPKTGAANASGSAASKRKKKGKKSQ